VERGFGSNGLIANPLSLMLEKGVWRLVLDGTIQKLQSVQNDASDAVQEAWFSLLDGAEPLPLTALTCLQPGRAQGRLQAGQGLRDVG